MLLTNIYKMKKLKYIIVLSLVALTFFLIGGYFGFNNGVSLSSQEINKCIESFSSENNNQLFSTYKIIDKVVEIKINNRSDCFSYEGLDIIYEVFFIGESKELSFNLNNNLGPNENGILSIEIEKIQPFDSIRFKKFLFSSYEIKI